jgi:hypothetical protein
MAENSRTLYMYIYHLTKFHTLSQSFSLVTKPKAAENITTAAMLLIPHLEELLP